MYPERSKTAYVLLRGSIVIGRQGMVVLFRFSAAQRHDTPTVPEIGLWFS
jgi:hypothetical protein